MEVGMNLLYNINTIVACILFAIPACIIIWGTIVLTQDKYTWDDN